MPWRVSVFCALLAGDDGRDALLLEPAEQPAQLRPQDRLVGQAGEQRLDGVQHDALGPDLLDHRVRGGRTGPPGRTRRSPRSRCARCARSRSPSGSARSGRSRSKPSEATFLARSSAVSSKVMKTPGSSNSVMPRTMNSIASSVLPDPAPPQTSVGRLRGKPPSVISSRPLMPVGHFCTAGIARATRFLGIAKFLSARSRRIAPSPSEPGDSWVIGRRPKVRRVPFWESIIRRFFRACREKTVRPGARPALARACLGVDAARVAIALAGHYVGDAVFRGGRRGERRRPGSGPRRRMEAGIESQTNKSGRWNANPDVWKRKTPMPEGRFSFCDPTVRRG